jgi:hypothetical protein
MNSLAFIIIIVGYNIIGEEIVYARLRPPINNNNNNNRHSVWKTTITSVSPRPGRLFGWSFFYTSGAYYSARFHLVYPNIPLFFSFLSLSSLSFVIKSSSSLLKFLGMSTLMVTKWSPRTLALPNLGAPLPLSRMT